MDEGVAGLARDKTRPSRIPPVPVETIDQVLALTNTTPPHEATHWTAAAMAKAVGVSISSVQRIMEGARPAPRRDGIDDTLAGSWLARRIGRMPGRQAREGGAADAAQQDWPE